jgi:hypothetical protein
VPRARPSNIWWKTITAKRVRKKLSPATTRVRPITAGVVVSGVVIDRGWFMGMRTERVENDAGF